MKFSSKCAHYLILRNALVEKKAKPQSVLVVAAKCRHRANCLFVVASFLATSFAIWQWLEHNLQFQQYIGSLSFLVESDSRHKD